MPIKKLFRSPKALIYGTGLATFFFGFGAGAVLNLYLISINSPLVTDLRSSLSFRSAIFGDGIILPIVNMIIVSVLLKNKSYLSKRILIWALAVGLLITSYFHIDQATSNLVNWAMPTPWHWNLLGLWHAIYMLSVATLISLFFLVSLKMNHKGKGLLLSVLAVIGGLVIFFILLGTDYS